MILSLLKKDPLKDAAAALYAATLEQARRPVFYADLGVADTLEGRFELLTLHVWIALRRLKDLGPSGRALARRTLEAFFADLDGNLREMGVGDLSMGRKMRGLAEGFYGRLGAYEAALSDDGGGSGLKEALARNVFAVAQADAGAALADYVRRAAATIADQSDGRLLAGIISFPAPTDGSAR